MLIVCIFTSLPKLWFLCHGSSLKWGLGIISKSATVGPCVAVHHCRLISHGWLRILETLLSNKKPLKPRLHLATCALSNHLESGILKRGKAPILWLLGMSVCFLCLHVVLGFVWGYSELLMAPPWVCRYLLHPSTLELP